VNTGCIIAAAVMALHDTSQSHVVKQLVTSCDGQAGARNNLQVPLLHKAQCNVSANGASIHEFCLVGDSGPEGG